MRKPLRVLVVSTVAFVAALFLAELGFQLVLRASSISGRDLEDFRDLVVEGRIRGFEPRAHTVFAVGPESPRWNSWGFADDEWALAGEEGALRVACLGGSTTQSGYPARLAKQLGARLGTPVEAMNCGVSGWTSAETLVAWFLRVRPFEPDVVVLHHAVNDVPPRTLEGFRHDYSHYRRPFEVPHSPAVVRLAVRWSDLAAWLLLREAAPTIETQTTHVASTERARRDAPADVFRRNVETIGRDAERSGASVVLMTMPVQPPAEDVQQGTRLRRGIAEHNEILRALAAEHGWGLADAERFFVEQRALLGGGFRDLVHLDDRGHLAKAHLAAEAIEALLERGG